MYIYFVYIHIYSNICHVQDTVYRLYINSKKLYIDNVETKVLLILLKKLYFYYILIIRTLFSNLIKIESK